MENGTENIDENITADTSNADELEDREVPEGLTADLFVDALKSKYCNYKAIKGFKVRPAVQPGENFMTVLQRVYIDVELEDAPPVEVSYIVKSLPKVDYMYDLVKEAKVFAKECYTYKKYLPIFEKMYLDVGKKVKFGPKMIDLSLPNLEDTVLVMEDLCLKGFKNVERQKGLDIAHTKATLTKLAQFHAVSACYFELNGPYPAVYNKCRDSRDKGLAYRLATGNLFRECLILYNDASYLDEKIKILTEQAPDPFVLEVVPQPHEFCVLNHGDMWMNNIMFQYDDKGDIREIYFVDYQFNRFGSPAQDLIYLLLSSPCLEIKLENFDYFMFYYNNELKNHLRLLNYPKQLPSLRELHIAIYRYANLSYNVISSLLPLVVFDQKYDEEADNVFSPEKGIELKRRMYQNKYFIEHLSQMLPWMNYRGLLDYAPWK